MESLIHSSEALAGAVLLPDKAFFELQDALFTLHGLGPRYAQVQNTAVHGRQLSFAMLDIAQTAYDLITDHDRPRELGTFDQLASEAEGALFASLDAAFKNDSRTKNFATRQQMALALIRSREEGLAPSDRIGMLRTARWAKQYERRAWWVCKHRVEAYSASAINWPAMGM
ncbi:MAG: hypothetical protein Q8R69_23655 [Telluria sp.]|nr:hypothetical protein [Telluria sp.]